MSVLSKESIFTYSNLVHAIAGGCGSAFAMSVFYPLDTVRTRLQVHEGLRSQNTFLLLTEIGSKEGLPGLYSGLIPVIQSLFCSNFVYFYTFHALKRIFNKDQSSIRNLFLGMLAGCVNVLSTTPLWVVNTRIKMQGIQKQSGISMEDDNTRRYKGLLDGLLQISLSEGVSSLWSGTLSSLLLVSNPAIQFMCYESMKDVMNGKFSTSEAFLAGALSKCVATFITYPIQLVQTKQRHGHTYDGLPQKANMVSLLKYIIRLQGFRGLYKGLESKVIQTVLTAALMFVCYEKIVKMIFYVMMLNRRR